MSLQELPERDDADDAEDSPTEQSVELTVSEGVKARLPPTADAEEAAAIVAAIATHLRAEDDVETPETIDQWKLAARLGSRQRGRLTATATGETWKLAGRTRRF